MILNRDRMCIVTVLVTHTLLLGWSATVHSPVIDEVGHLPAGLSHWHLRRFDLYNVNPPLVRIVAALPAILGREPISFEDYQTLPATRSEFTIGMNWITSNPERLMPVYTPARWACIPFSLLGAAVCYLWTRDLYGATGARFSLFCWCFSPTILGHASLITPDTGSAALGCAACYVFWKWLRRPHMAIALFSGLLLGLTLLTKFTWLILLVLWPAWWLIWKIRGPSANNDVPLSSNTRTTVGLPFGPQLLLIFVSSWFIVNTGYLWEDTFQELGEFQFSSTALGGTSDIRSDGRGNRFRGTILEYLPFPGPRNFLQGLDHIKHEYEVGYRSYLRGQMKDGGWWYYYLYAMLVKMPLGTLLLIQVSVIMMATSLWQQRARTDDGSTTRQSTSIADELYLLSPVVAVLYLVSSQTGFNHHLRYVLPVFPFLFILAGRTGLLLLSRNRLIRCLPTIAVLATIVSSISVFPHSISYFNEAAGGCKNGWRHLDNSNIDWGQDLLMVKEWSDSHPQARPLYLRCFSLISPETLGVPSRTPAQLPQQVRTVGHTDTSKWPSGWYILSLSSMVNPENRLQEFLSRPPDDLIGYSIRVYHVPSNRPD